LLKSTATGRSAKERQVGGEVWWGGDTYRNIKRRGGKTYQIG